MWKKAATVSFKVQSQNLLGQTYENHETLRHESQLNLGRNGFRVKEFECRLK